jgi:hypothetical protein
MLTPLGGLFLIEVGYGKKSNGLKVPDRDLVLSFCKTFYPPSSSILICSSIKYYKNITGREILDRIKKFR